MAIPIFNPCPPPQPIPDRARNQNLPKLPQDPPAGSLVLVDTFEDTFQGAAHGNTAAFAARQQGFRGPIYAESIGPDGVRGPTQSVNARSFLAMGPQDPAVTRQAVMDISRLTHRELLEDVTGDLNKIAKTGLHDSAVNVSYGTSPQRVAEDIYRQVRQPFGGHFTQNIFQAYGIDAEKFNSHDPKVSGPERARLQQALLQAAEAGVESADVKMAEVGYDQAVRGLKSRHNSVVVSAGNQQQVLDHLAADANGQRIQPGSPNSNHNILANSSVTTVGATRWFQNGKERLANYSNRDPEVDIYASGSVGSGADVNKMNSSGTSYSSPRVATALATLHLTHPGRSSSQMENLMRNRLTHQTEGQSVLDYTRTEEFLRNQRF